MQIEAKKIKKELKTGVHLVTIADAWLHKDGAGQPIKTKEGDCAMVVRFSDSKNNSYDQIFWMSGENHKHLLKMCTAFHIDPLAPKFKAESLGKRAWIAIKEVWDVIGEDYATNDVTGDRIVNYYIFQYSPVLDVKNVPVMKGDPARNEGKASDKFLDFRQVGIDTPKVNPVQEAKTFIATAKEKKGIPDEDDNFPETFVPKDENGIPDEEDNFSAEPVIKTPSAMTPNNDFFAKGKETSEEEVPWPED